MERSAEKVFAGLGWLLIAASVVVNAWLTYKVGQFRFGDRPLQAQADFEIFMLLLTLGLPIAVLAVIFLLVIALANLRTQNFFASMLKNPSALFCMVNALVPIGLLAYLLSMR